MAPFWQVKPLAAMSLDEWEQLCDGCGRCCLKKMELPDGTVRYTRVACTLLDIEHCRCRAYADRGRKVLTCMVLSSEFVANHAYLLPSTCAYRLLQEGGGCLSGIIWSAAIRTGFISWVSQSWAA